MPTLHIYRSTDSGASALTGQAGSLAAASAGVLYTCLVSGYGSQAGVGWTQSYSGTNKNALAQGAGQNFILRTQDDGPGGASYLEARIRGYEAMTTIDAGTNLFPTAAQMTNGAFVRKSASLDSTARAWRMFADTKCCYFFAMTGDYTNIASGFIFGDIVPYRSGDSYLTTIMGRYTENQSIYTYDTVSMLNGGNSAANFAATSAHYIVRPASQVAGAVGIAKMCPLFSTFGTTSPNTSAGNYGLTYPLWDGSMLIDRVWEWESTSVVRGYWPGLWVPIHVRPLADGAQIGPIDLGDGVSRTFEAVSIQGASSASGGQLLIEVSDTWYQ